MIYLIVLVGGAVLFGLIASAVSIFFQGWFGGNIGKKHMEELGAYEDEDKNYHE